MTHLLSSRILLLASARFGYAGVTDWLENILESSGVVTPALRLENESSSHGYGHYHAVRGVMQLASIAAAFVQIAE